MHKIEQPTIISAVALFMAGFGKGATLKTIF